MRAIPVLADTTALELEVLPPGRGLDEALREAGAVPAFHRVLRVATSLRGGVSLAVWIAGALAELDLVRRIRIVRTGSGSLRAFVLWPDTSAAHPAALARIAQYARVLAAAGYDEVQFDVISGASAGGLSAVLFAVAQRAGTSLDGVLTVFRDRAGLKNLLQPPGLGDVEAPLRGDAYFWPTATSAVAELHRRGLEPARSHPDLVAGRLSVHLSATVINSEAESEPDILEGRGHFVFRADDRDRVPQPNGVPRAAEANAPEPPDVQLLRLAYAARATSSLPGGFEVARVVSPSETRREVLEGSEAQAPVASEAVRAALQGGEEPSPLFASGALRPNFAFAFSSHRPPRDTPGDTGPYEVIDGGIFDNVPIDRALGVITATVGPTYGDRALLDLDPDPQDPRANPTASQEPRDRVALATVLRAWMRRVQRRESAAEELDQVHRFNAAIMAEQGRLEALAAVLGGVDVAARAGADRLRGYLRNVGGTDAVFLVDAISRPSRWQLTSPLPRRRKLRALPAERLAPLLPALMASYAAAPDPNARAERLTSALLDAGNAVLAWVRAIEGRNGHRRRAESDALEHIRDHVADALAFAHRARDAAAFRVLLLTSRHAAGDPDAPLSDELVALLLRAWQERARGEDGRTRQEREDAALLAHHRILDEDLQALRALSPDEDAADEAGAPWRATIWHAVDERFRGRQLRTLDLIALVAPAGMHPPMSVVATARISSDERPAVPSAFPSVTAERRRLALQDAVDGRPGMSASLTARAKLGGRGIGNLQGLLSAEWREGDWWWGRLDAAAGILRFLGSRAPRGPEAVEDLVELAQDALRAEAGGDEPLRAGADGIGSLSPQYRVALGTRALGAGLRSAAPPGSGGGARAGARWKRWGFLLLEALLRPLLLLAPLATAPVRFVVALGALAGLGWGVTRTLEPDAGGGAGLLELVLPAAAVLAVLAAVLVAARPGVRRWKALASGEAPRPPGVTPEDSESARRTAARLSDAAAVVAVLAGALLGWSAAEGRLLASAGWLLVTLGAALWAIRLRTRVPLLQAPLGWPPVVGGVAAFAVLAVTGPVLDLTVRLAAPVDGLGLAQLLGFAAVFSVVFVVGWEGLDKVVLALMAGAAVWLLGALVLLLVPGEGTPGWIPPVAFLLAWSNVLWAALMLRPALGFPSDAPRRTAHPRWFSDPA